jgi:glycosyltransferase involved in cell wall biosynthesis
MKRPAVSVVIPTYNRSWGLRRAMESVLWQTFADFELIVVDDASADDTPVVAWSFDDDRVRYHRQAANVGVARNWGTGLSLAQGELIAILMDDDRYEATFLAHCIEALERRPVASFAFTGYRVLDEAGTLRKVHAPRHAAGSTLVGPDLLRATLAQDCFIGATVYRAAALQQVWRQAESAGLIVDHAANIRLALQPGAAAVFVGGIEFIQADHPGQLSQSRAEAVFRSTFDLYRRLARESIPGWARRLIRHHAAYLLVQDGRSAASRGERSVAFGQFMQAARLHPFWSGSWRQMVRTLLPVPTRPDHIAGVELR